MNKNFAKNICLLICFVLLLYSCSSECSISGIKVNELLFAVSKDRGIDYCSLLEEAVNGNELAIREISLLKFDDATGYAQGTVIVEMILKLGEEKYLKSISSISVKEKKLIKAYIDIGFEYNESKDLKNKELAELFPKVNSFLEN